MQGVKMNNWELQYCNSVQKSVSKNKLSDYAYIAYF